MIDPRREAVLIYNPGTGNFEDKTSEVVRCRPAGNGRVGIVFKNRSKPYLYGLDRLRILQSSKRARVSRGQKVEVDGVIWQNATDVCTFDDHDGNWSRVSYKKQQGEAYSRLRPAAHVRILSSVTESPVAARVMNYLRDVASCLPSDDSIRRVYESLDFVHPESALASFLTGATITTRELAALPIFPFRCNLSQREAIERALTTSISVIEGPPGTGKTETILNLIANIMATGAGTVGVVSLGNALSDPRWRGDDGSPLTMSPLPGLGPGQIDTTQRSLWRYQAVLPVAPEHRISLGEGWTPMIELAWSGHLVHFKLEWFNPTSSFKDRGVSVMMSHLRGQGVTRVLEDSSGNGGSSVAAYAAAAGIAARIIVPAATSAAKVLQSRAYGAEIELVPGTRDEVSAEAVRQSAKIPYASHNWHPMFLQGTKTVGYEMWEMLGFRAPDNVVLVAGAGSIVLACDIAFSELLEAGQIQRRPRLLVGQPEHWAAIADAVNGIDPAARGPRVATIAEGASIANPVRLAETVRAVKMAGVFATDG